MNRKLWEVFETLIADITSAHVIKCKQTRCKVIIWIQADVVHAIHSLNKVTYNTTEILHIEIYDCFQLKHCIYQNEIVIITLACAH